MKFWQKMLHLFGGRLCISLVRNDGMYMATGCKWPHIMFERLDNEGDGWFFTLHARRYFFNVDWV